VIQWGLKIPIPDNLVNNVRKEVFKSMDVDRVENWKKFSQHMEEYIQKRTVEKYGIDNSGGFDLMSITRSPLICVWHILKYSLRIWNDKGKEHDLEKIAHYAELAWTMSGDEVIENETVRGHQMSR